MKKMSFENIKNVLSRNEMKKIMAGSGGGCGQSISCSGKKDGDACGTSGSCACETHDGGTWCNTQV